MRLRFKQLWIVLVIYMGFLSPFSVFAHTSALGEMDARINGNVIDLEIILAEERTLDDIVLFEQYAQENIHYTNNNTECSLTVGDFITGSDAENIPTTIFIKIECAEEIENLTVFSSFFADEGYEFSANFTKDEITQNVIFTVDDSEASLVFNPTPTQKDKTSALITTIKNFIGLGMVHIYSGYDHILFVLALMLGVLRIRRLLGIITAFTIAHSITLILSAFDVVTVSPALIEPLIALSIIYVAFEDIIFGLWQRLRKKSDQIQTLSHRWKVAFGFGLFHGLGFAGILKDIKIPESTFIPSLISFNIGVEIGQLTIIAAMFPLLYFASKTRFQKHIIFALSIIVGLVGLFWFLQRVFF